MSRTLRGIGVCLGCAQGRIKTRSENQCSVQVNGLAVAGMLDPPLAIRAEGIKAYAVPGLVHFRHQPGADLHPVAGGDFAFEDRELHALTIILARPGDPPQPSASPQIRHNDRCSRPKKFEIFYGF